MKNLENVTLMDYREFDNLVKKYFPFSNYKCVASNEWSNDEEHLYTISPLKPLDLLPDSYYNKYTKPRVEEFLQTGKEGGYLSAYEILDYLVNEMKVLSHGHYLIEVSW